MIKIIEIPNVVEIHANSKIMNKLIWEEKERKAKEESIRKNQIAIPELVEYINKRIKEESNKGNYSVNFNLKDENWSEDDRVEYSFKGHFDYHTAEIIEKIFKSAGYRCEVYKYEWVNCYCYRTGEIKIDWYNI